MGKCGALLLSPWNKEWKLELDVRMGEEAIQTVANLKLLGLHVDHGLTFNLHVSEVMKSAARKNNVLKCLTSPSNGLQKEELTRVYRACTRSVTYYATPTWTPLISQTNWNKLEIGQNNALRIITGCTKMTQTDHLRHETRCIPVRNLCEMMTCQFSSKMKMPDHPNFRITTPQPRQMKTSLDKFLEKKLQEFNISPQKKMDRVWHTAFVRKSVEEYEPNKVLEDHPHMDPVKVDELEEGMTRKERRIVAQMRSG